MGRKLDEKLTSRCYCGSVKFECRMQPETVAFCHCNDCHPMCCAPIAAFAAFASETVFFMPSLGAGFQMNAGVQRWFCHTCGSQLAATFGYLPKNMYIPVDVLDFAPDLVPLMHSHMDSALAWIDIADTLPRHAQSARSDMSTQRIPQ